MCIENELGIPRITKDGVTVAKNVMLVLNIIFSFDLPSILQRNKLEEMGASLLRKASGLTNMYAGDGTTSTIIIAEAILQLFLFNYSFIIAMQWVIF